MASSLAQMVSQCVLITTDEISRFLVGFSLIHLKADKYWASPLWDQK